MHILLSAKKLYAKSENQDLCLTSIAYLNLLSRSGTNCLRFSKPSCIFNDGGNCMSNAKVLSWSGNIAWKKYSSSLLASFRRLSCVITLGNLTVNLKLSGVLSAQFL